MLKTNVIPKTYRVILRTPAGKLSTSYIAAESEAAARLKVLVPYGWTIEAVEEC